MLGLCATLACSSNASMRSGWSGVHLRDDRLERRDRPDPEDHAESDPDPVFITVISTFVTIVDYADEGLHPGPVAVARRLCAHRGQLHRDGPAEAFASKNTVLASLMDGIGMSIGSRSSSPCSGWCASSRRGDRVQPAGARAWYPQFLFFILPAFPGARVLHGGPQAHFARAGGEAVIPRT